MHLVIAGPGRYDGGVERPPGPDGGPPAEVEIIGSRELVRTEPDGTEIYRVTVLVYTHAGENRDGVPRYTRDRDYTEERAG